MDGAWSAGWIQEVTARRLGEALASPRWSEKDGILMLRDEASGSELEDELAIHLLVEVEVKAVGYRRIP